MRAALITGVTGQDGSYMAEQLLDSGQALYNVYGLIRRSSTGNRKRIQYLESHPRFHTRFGDVTDITSISDILEEIWAKHGDEISRLEVYNLAAMSHVGISFKMPIYTSEVDALGVLNVLEAIRKSGYMHMTRFYQASTSELFGKVQEIPQVESTPFYPRSPYGVAKLYGFWITKNYREAYGMFACNGVLFNHEADRRGCNFVTKKITKAVASIKKSFENDLPVTPLRLGNLEAARDWGYAPDYVRGMRMMLDREGPDDYILATGESRTVRHFVEAAFSAVELSLKWEGHGTEEIGLVDDTVVVEIDEQFFRPSEVNELLGNYSKAKELLGWEPQTKFEDMVKEMVEADYNDL